MKKIDSLRRFLLPCMTPTATISPTTTKKRLSTSLRDDIPEHPNQERDQSLQPSSDDDGDDDDEDQQSVNSYPTSTVVPPRASKSMVIGTLFGHRRGHVCFCIQHDRLTSKPSLFLELSMPTYLLVKEMQCGLVRIALESSRKDLGSCPLSLVPVWGMCINGRKVGFASRRKVSDRDRLVLKTMQSTTVGAGVIPSMVSEEGELIYTRANYERVLGSADSESFHLINPDADLGQEFSIFLMRGQVR